MFLINISDPITLLLILFATVLLIFLAKEVKKPYIVAIPLAVYLILAIIYSVQLGLDSMVEYKRIILNCIAIDCIMIFITFFSYLWVDDIACNFYKKKSISNSLDWFWKNI